MRNAGIFIFSLVFASLVAARSWGVFEAAKSNAEECGRIIASLEKVKADEGDIIEALLTYAKNSAANRSFVLANEPIRKDHEKSMKRIDEQIDALHGRAEKGWRTLAVNLFLDTLTLASLVVIVAVWVFPARKKHAPAKRAVRKARTDSGE